MAYAGHGTRCRLHDGGVGSRVFLGDESGPPRIAFCPTCDIASDSVVGLLPPGARLALDAVAGPVQ